MKRFKMKKLTCREKVRLIYTTQLMEDPSMSLERAWQAHKVVCKLKDCPAEQELRKMIKIPERGLGK